MDELAQQHVTRDLATEWVERVAECAYRHELKRDQVLAVLRVVLRDEMLRVGGFVGTDDSPATR